METPTTELKIKPGRVVQYAIDAALMCATFVLAYLLRFDFSIPPGTANKMLFQMPLAVGLQWLLLLGFGAYRRIWRFISLVDVPPFLAASVLAALPMALLRATAKGYWPSMLVPYSVILMYAALSFMALLGIRIFRRATVERYQKQAADLSRREAGRKGRGGRVVLMGAGRAGVMAARELSNRANSGLKVVGFLDDDGDKRGAMIAGIPVLGPIGHVRKLAERGEVDEAIITIANAHREQIARIVRTCEEARVPTRIIPALHEILSGAVSIASLRPVEIEDLLGREVVLLDGQSISRFIAGKRVMVTGAGGSIGAEMARQLHGYGPAQLVLAERCEYALYEIHREMLARGSGTRLAAVVADVGDAGRMEKVLGAYRPQVVIHAAAYKHVPLMEGNEGEAIRNNALGTRTVAEACGRSGVEVFVLISTDKAVNPTSVMGASKRLAEIAAQDLGERYPGTRYVAVRFGNVLGSTGSVIPLFREQIRRGGPVTVTHPDMQRYFMTIPEASQLVLQAAAMGRGGEIFVLDMGAPVKIADLARDMIRLSGLEPEVDVRIEYTGLRPGEKLFEELHTDEEKAERTRHPMIFVGKIPKYDSAQVERMLRELGRAALEGDAAGLRALLNRHLPEARIAVSETARPEAGRGKK